MAAATGSLIMGMSSAAGGVAQANSLRAQGRVQRMGAEANARQGRKLAEEAEAKGNANANKARRQGKKIEAAQRVAAAAQGLDPNSGDFADLLDETEMMAELDATAIKTNALKEAFGYESSAMNTESQGELNQMAAENAARGTVLTGGMQALGYGLEGIAKSNEAKEKRRRAGREESEDNRRRDRGEE